MIETPRLLLRPHGLADVEPLHRIFTDPLARRFIAAPPPSREDVWNRILRYAGHWTLLGFGMFAVLDKATGRFLGEVGLADFGRGLGETFDGLPEAAWIFDPAIHGRGYAFEAATAAHRWFDGKDARSRTVCIIGPDNGPSLGLAAKLGYAAFGQAPYKGVDVTMLERIHTSA